MLGFLAIVAVASSLACIAFQLNLEFMSILTGDSVQTKAWVIVPALLGSAAAGFCSTLTPDFDQVSARKLLPYRLAHALFLVFTVIVVACAWGAGQSSSSALIAGRDAAAASGLGLIIGAIWRPEASAVAGVLWIGISFSLGAESNHEGYWWSAAIAPSESLSAWLLASIMLMLGLWSLLLRPVAWRVQAR